METVKWNENDHKAHEKEIAGVLLMYIDDDEKEQARHISYGDLGKLMQKRHGSSYNGATCGENYASGSPGGVKVELRELHREYELTWNKAAKLINRYIDRGAADPAAVSEAELDEVSSMISQADEYSEAVRCHADIIAGAGLAQQGLVQMARGFKRMRDDKLYKSLGYSSFEEYCEKETGLNRRTVYRYISIAEKMSEEFVTSMSQIGVAKLSLLATLDEGERADIAGSTDLDSVTVKELRAQIDTLTKGKERADKAYRTLTENYDSLNRTHIADIKEKTELKKEYDRVHALYDAGIDENVRLKRQNTTLSDAMKAAEKQLDQLQTEYANLKESYDELEDGGAAALIDAGDLDGEQIEAIAEHSSLVFELRREVDSLTRKNGELSDERNDLDDSYRKELEEMQEKNAELEREIEAMKKLPVEVQAREVTPADLDARERITRDAEFQVKYKAAYEYTKLLCIFVHNKGNDFMKQKARSIVDLIETCI